MVQVLDPDQAKDDVTLCLQLQCGSKVHAMDTDSLKQKWIACLSCCSNGQMF